MGEMEPKQDSEPPPSSRRKKRSGAEKLRIVTAAAGLDETALGAMLCHEGVHSDELTEWREQAAMALGGKRAQRSGEAADRRRIKELERELLRKERALAEAAALLVLRKKVEALWAQREDAARTDPSASRSSRRSRTR